MMVAGPDGSEQGPSGVATRRTRPEADKSRALNRVLHARRRAWAREGFFYRGGADLLLSHGSYYSGRRRPSEYNDLVGMHYCCFRNSADAASADTALRYCEGLLAVGGRIGAHAWCLDPDDLVVDVTEAPEQWGAPERWGYHGAVFSAQLALRYMASIGAYTAALLDGLDEGDPREDWPILRVPYDAGRTELPGVSSTSFVLPRYPSRALIRSANRQLLPVASTGDCP
jgi:hypothetical protein